MNRFLIYLLFLNLFFFVGCKKNTPNEESVTHLVPSDDGFGVKRVGKGRLPTSIETETVFSHSLSDKLTIPIRVTVQCPSTRPIRYLFETPEQSSLYSEYLKTSAALAGAQKSYSRIKYLVENKALAGKELNDALIQLEQWQAAHEEAKNRLMIAAVPIEDLHRLVPGEVIITADIPEAKSESVKKGTTIVMIFSAHPGQQISSKIDFVSDGVDPISRTIKARLIMKNPNQFFQYGMFGSASLENSITNAMTVPSKSLVFIGEKTYIYREEPNGDFRAIQVITGIESPEYTEIKSGLALGDRIVVKGADLLKGISFGY
jgi:multidrug efflux pump subunit AcrA (membrane-fusion protein)